MNDERKCAHSFRADFSADCASAAAFPRRCAVDAAAAASSLRAESEQPPSETADTRAFSFAASSAVRSAARACASAPSASAAATHSAARHASHAPATTPRCHACGRRCSRYTSPEWVFRSGASVCGVERRSDVVRFRSASSSPRGFTMSRAALAAVPGQSAVGFSFSFSFSADAASSSAASSAPPAPSTISSIARSEERCGQWSAARAIARLAAMMARWSAFCVSSARVCAWVLPASERRVTESAWHDDDELNACGRRGSVCSRTRSLIPPRSTKFCAHSSVGSIESTSLAAFATASLRNEELTGADADADADAATRRSESAASEIPSSREASVSMGVSRCSPPAAAPPAAAAAAAPASDSFAISSSPPPMTTSRLSTSSASFTPFACKPGT